MGQAIAFINPKISTKNVGDYFIEDSVKRLLDFDKERSVEIDPRRPLNPGDIEKINACDAAVIVGTNLWYTHLAKPGRWMIGIDELRKIKVPFIPLGVGTTQHRNEKDSFKFDSETIALLKEIHNKCNESSARDPRTYETLKSAGMNNVKMTGCATLYRSLEPRWVLNKKKTDKVVVTARKGQDKNINIIIDELISRGKTPVIAAQKKKDLYCARRRFPGLKQKVKALYEFDIKPYQELVDSSYGAIGWRLHGNMFHLAHGNPTMFFANCSRCLSFSEAFDLPCIYAEDKESVDKKILISAVENFLNADYFSGFEIKYMHYFQEMKKFLEINGLQHNMG